EAVRLSLHDMPDARQAPPDGEPFEVCLDAVGLKVDPPDDCDNEWMSIRQLEQPFGFGERLPRLDGNASRDAGGVHLALDVGGQEVALQRGHRAVDPVVFLSMISPEMLMRVDHLTGGLRPAGSPYTLTRADPDPAPFA